MQLSLQAVRKSATRSLSSSKGRDWRSRAPHVTSTSSATVYGTVANPGGRTTRIPSLLAKLSRTTNSHRQHHRSLSQSKGREVGMRRFDKISDRVRERSRVPVAAPSAFRRCSRSSRERSIHAVSTISVPELVEGSRRRLTSLRRSSASEYGTVANPGGRTTRILSLLAKLSGTTSRTGSTIGP